MAGISGVYYTNKKSENDADTLVEDSKLKSSDIIEESKRN